MRPSPEGRRLQIYITNFEFLRSQARLKQLMPACGHRTWLVGDESSFLKNHKSQQTVAFLQLRNKCGRVTLLNGTPIYHSPLDLFSQGNLLSPTILDCKYITLFKARYAIQTPVLGAGGKPLDNGHGKAVMKVESWTNLDDLERRFKPYTRRRLQAECLDLPPKLDPVTLTAVLTPETWKSYTAMRDELVIWLSEHEVTSPATAAIKVMRLSQITSGFVGGVEESYVSAPMDAVADLSLFDQVKIPGMVTSEVSMPFDALPRDTSPLASIGREKLNVLLWFIGQRLEEDPNLHLVVWCRWVEEVRRTLNAVKHLFPQFQTGMVVGGQKRADRLTALALLKPETSPKGPVFVVGIEGTGSFGLDMTAAHTCVTMSSGYSPGKFAQTLNRVYGPGQQHPIAYYNIIAVGPKHQRTIDRDILIARTKGEDLAQRTAKAWVRALTGDHS